MTLELIEGGGETVAEPLIPVLVKDPDGRICMQLRLGPYEATLAIPDHLAGCTEERLQAFFNAVVPEMTDKLYAMRRRDNRKLRRKARCSTGSIKAALPLEDETLPQPRRT